MVRTRGWLTALAFLGALIPVSGRSQQPVPVDLQLVLAVDSSGSITADEFRVQMEGLTAAFRNPLILDAIRRGPIGAIAITLVEWSSVEQQHQSIAWTLICDAESIAL